MQLTQREKTVLELREAGLSFAEIGKRFGVSKQAAASFERRGLAKLGRRISVSQAGRAEYGAIYRDYSRRVSMSELTFTEGKRMPSSAMIRQRRRDCAERKIDILLDGGRYTWEMIRELQS